MNTLIQEAVWAEVDYRRDQLRAMASRRETRGRLFGLAARALRHA